MSFASYIFFARKRMSSTKMTVYSILVTTIGLTLFLFSTIFSKVLNSGRESIMRCISGDIDRYAVALIDNSTFFDASKGNAIYQEIIDSQKIYSFGTWDPILFDISAVNYQDTDYFSQLKEIQDTNIKYLSDINPAYFQGINIPAAVFKFNSISLEQGTIASLDLNKATALLGSNFKDIPLGTVIKTRSGDEYTVEGIVSKNQEIIDSHSILSNLGGLDFDYTIPLDNMILLIDPDTQGRAIDSDAVFISFAEGISYEEGKETIESIFASYGTEIKMGKLSDRIDEVMSRTDWILNRFNASSVIFLFLSITTILCIQMMAFFTRKEEVGIWISNGLESKDVFRILFLENIIKILISYIFSLGIYIFVLKINNITGSQMHYLREVLFVYGPLIVLAAGIGIATGVSMISIVYIKKKTIPDIINGNW